MSQKANPLPIFRGLECSKVYMDAKDKNVAKTVIYVNDYDASSSEDYIPYADEGQTRVLSPDELLDAFAKGAVVSVKATDGTEYAMVLLAAYCTTAPTMGAMKVHVEGMIANKRVLISVSGNTGKGG